MTNRSSGGRVALITGANKGIGFEISRQLANRGITVVIGARDETRGAEAAARLYPPTRNHPPPPRPRPGFVTKGLTRIT
jgi:NAD(P)-dependent dehydrogenase (short-subunit alcohol dehydrogenase family)